MTQEEFETRLAAAVDQLVAANLEWVKALEDLSLEAEKAGLDQDRYAIAAKYHTGRAQGKIEAVAAKLELRR